MRFIELPGGLRMPVTTRAELDEARWMLRELGLPAASLLAEDSDARDFGETGQIVIAPPVNEH